MRRIITLGFLVSAAAATFGACSGTPNSAGDDGGPLLGGGDEGGGEGGFAGSGDAGGNLGSSGGGSSSGVTSSSGARGSSSSGGRSGSSSGRAAQGDGGCAPSCVRLMNCCPMLAQVDAGALTMACNAAASSCNDTVCTPLVNMSIGGQKCPP